MTDKSDKSDDWDTLVEISPAETRVAFVDADGLLRRFRIQRMNAANPLGAIYRGRIKKIEKSMGGAFVDLGDAASGDTFLPRLPKAMTEGQSAIVQILRAPESGKGAAITLKPALRGRYATYFPTGGGVSFDRRIGQGRRRAELAPLETGISPANGGFQVNWPAVAVSATEVLNEVEKLGEEWRQIETLFSERGKPGLLLSPLDLAVQALLDAPPGGRVALDDPRLYSLLKKRAEAEWPDLSDGLLFHDRRQPIFSSADIDDQIDTLIERVVPIPGGGSLSIDPVEAMTVIDVNLADAAIAPDGAAATVKLNLRAAREVARQIELRNLCGLIVVDFVSMRNKVDRKRIVEALRNAVRNSVSPTDVLGITAAGLVEITRQRGDPPVSEYLLDPAPRAVEPHPSAQAAQALRRLIGLTGAGMPVIRARPVVLGLFREDFGQAFRETENRLGQSIRLDERNSPDVEVLLER